MLYKHSLYAIVPSPVQASLTVLVRYLRIAYGLQHSAKNRENRINTQNNKAYNISGNQAVYHIKKKYGICR